LRLAIDANTLVAWAATDDKQFRVARLNHLFENRATVLIVPTPALAEFLVGADSAGQAWLAMVEKKRAFQVAGFDRRSASECADLDKIALAGKDKKQGSKAAWQKVKVDRQILAIARVNRADLLITEDSDLLKLASACKMPISKIEDLELPDSARQHNLELDHPEE